MSALRGGRRGGGVAGTCSSLVYTLCDVDLSLPVCLLWLVCVRNGVAGRDPRGGTWDQHTRRTSVSAADGVRGDVGGVRAVDPAGRGVRGRRVGRGGAVNGGPDGGGGAGAWCALALCACMVFIHTSPARAECAVCASRAALPWWVLRRREGGHDVQASSPVQAAAPAKETGPRCGLRTTNGHGRHRRVAWAAGWAAAWTEAGSATAAGDQGGRGGVWWAGGVRNEHGQQEGGRLTWRRTPSH
jgi:hypothetical protein